MPDTSVHIAHRARVVARIGRSQILEDDRKGARFDLNDADDTLDWRRVAVFGPHNCGSWCSDGRTLHAQGETGVLVEAVGETMWPHELW